MRSLIILFIAVFFLSACENAKFDIEGNQNNSSLDNDTFEVVPEDEVGNLVDNQDLGDDGLGDKKFDNDDDGICTHCPDDKDKKPYRRRKDHDGNCQIKTPKEVYKDKGLVKKHSCHKREKKLNICQYPSGDDDKKHTLCVSENSITDLLQKRRQDAFIIGRCEDQE